MTTTTSPNGCVEIRMEKEGPGAAEPKTVIQAFKEQVARAGNDVAVAHKEGDEWKKYNWTQYYEMCCKAAKSMIHLGLKPSQSANIIGFNSVEWFVADLGCILAGGMAAGIYTTNGPEACHYISEHSDAAVIFCEGVKQLDKFLQIRERLPELKALVMWGPEELPSNAGEGVYTWNQFLELSSNVEDSVLESRMEAQKPGHCCTLIYTSGTTGNPKAVMISHDNVTFTCRQTVDHCSLNHDITISYLPLSHIAAQMVDIHAPMCHGGSTWFAQPDALKGSLVKTLTEVRPTLFFGVPRVWEKIEEKMRQVGAQTTGLKKTIATWAKGEGLNAYRNEQFPPKGKGFFFGIAQAIVLNKIRVALGFDRCKLFLTGAAPIAKETLEYFGSLYIPICELYGMSECSGPQTISVPSKFRIGATGTSIPGTRLEIVNPDAEGHGEICFAGRHVMMGYMKNPDATRDTIDADGLLHSGDVGYVDAEGFLRITGRIKELLITAGGENVPPVYIENSIKSVAPALSNVVVIGDKRKFLAALITIKAKANDDGSFSDELTPESAPVDPECKTVGDATKSEKWRKYVQDAVDKYNSTMAISQAQKVQKFTFLPTDFSVNTDELTPTLKLKRKIVNQKYEKEIETLYE